MHRRDRDEEPEWAVADSAADAAFDAALRAAGAAGEGDLPPVGLRDACLPPALREGQRVHRILAVDDEPSILRLIEHHLRRDGYEVRTARNGREALETVRAWRPDILVLDVMMPEVDGLRVLRALKEDPATVEIRVVLLTARGGDDDIRTGWHDGTDFYMTKPFNPAMLRWVVDRMVAALGTPEDPPPLRRWLK